MVACKMVLQMSRIEARLRLQCYAAVQVGRALSILLLRIEIYQQKILSILLKFDMTEDLFYEHRGWVYLKFCNLLFLNNKR